MPEVLTEVQESDLRDFQLDKRIALALGLKPTITWAIFNADETALMIDFERKAEAIKWWDEHPSVHAEHHIGELECYEPYSTNIESAMRIVERLGQQGWQASMVNCRVIGSRVEGNIRAWWVEFSDLSCNRFESESDLLPEAICAAALKALESNDGNRKS